MPISDAPPIIIADGVIKQFGRFAALRGVNAEFAPGRLYVVLGEKKIKTVCSQIGYMAHPSLLYDEMTGLENLRYFAGLYGIHEDAANFTCREAIISVKLDPDLNRPVGQYSQGMRQRMSLARALLNDPTLLLLDEPFSNVDFHSAQEMATLLGQMRDQGRTLLVVTHQPGLLESVADEFVWM